MTAADLEGLTRVFTGPRHEVYCDGTRRVWVDRRPVNRELVSHASPCPRCVCSAFGATKAAPR